MKITGIRVSELPIIDLEELDDEDRLLVTDYDSGPPLKSRAVTVGQLKSLFNYDDTEIRQWLNDLNDQLINKVSIDDNGSVSIGYNTEAPGYYSHSEGELSQAVGDASHAEGVGCFSLGCYSKSFGTHSHVGAPILIGNFNLIRANSNMGDKTNGANTGTENSGRYNATRNIDVLAELDLSEINNNAVNNIKELGITKIIWKYQGDAHQNDYSLLYNQNDEVIGKLYGGMNVPSNMMWNNHVIIYTRSPYLLRGFIGKQNLYNNTDFFSEAGSRFTLYLFNDLIEDYKLLDPDDFDSYYCYGSVAGGLGCISGGPNGSLALGSKCNALGTQCFALGYDTTATDRSFAIGCHNSALGHYAMSLGKCTEANADYSTVMGMCASSKNNDSYSFTWSGVGAGHNTNNYQSHGPGSFSINPNGGLKKFFIGTNDFVQSVIEAVKLMTPNQKVELKSALEL